MAELLNTKHYNILDICIKLRLTNAKRKVEKLNGEAKKICVGMEILLVYGKRTHCLLHFQFQH